MMYFFSKHRWHLLLYAAIAYVIKLLRDLLLKGIGQQPTYFKRDTIGASEKLRWQKIRCELAAKNE